MLNSLQVTLTPRGAELAGRCVLELLKRFEGRQIATLGLTAVPILNSAIMQSGGRYHGLLVRQQRKKHGSLKLIEGPIDPDEPTIVIDNSISSGTSMQLACDTLRDAGIRVEGGIFLVQVRLVWRLCPDAGTGFSRRGGDRHLERFHLSHG